MPGSGQFMQKRWIPGVIFSSSFLVCFTLFAYHVCGIFAACYRLVRDFDTIMADDVNVPLADVFFFFMLCLVVWGVGLYDTWKAQREAQARLAAEKLAKTVQDIAS